MKPFLSSIPALLLMFAIGAETDAADPVHLRVLSYNIHHGEGVDRKLDLERIAKVIQSVKPDLVALQEVDKVADRTGRVDQPAELARLTKLHIAFGGNIEFQGGEYGNAVLSRFPIVRHKNHVLPSFDEGEQRGVIEVELKLDGSSQPLLLYATHLDNRINSRERLASAKAINILAARHPQRPALLAGDLNDSAKSKTLERFETHWTRANEKPLGTVPVTQPAKQYDYILFRPKDRWKVVEVKVLDERVASDHRAIFAVLELQPKRD